MQHSKRSSINYGYGRKLEYAMENALKTYYGGGKYATTHTHISRCLLFICWLRSEHGIRDARKITNDIFIEYAYYLKYLLNEDEIELSTATNRISSVNIMLKALRGDNVIRIGKIADTLEAKRSYIRRVIPDGMDIQQVAKLRTALITAGYERTAAIIWLARTTGMRLRECILADLPRLEREAKKIGQINIQNGCKGGRSGSFAPRWIPVTREIVSALNYALEVSPVGSKNLLKPSESYIHFTRHEVDKARPLVKQNGIKGPHELRAAYACDRYMELTGIAAPVFLRPAVTSAQAIEAIRKARQIISRELGHERPEITNSYVGSEEK